MSMVMTRKIQRIVARAPEELAHAIGRSATDGKKWHVQYQLLKGSDATLQKKTPVKREGL